MPAPIFVLSTARSGSTLTRLILDTHPEIYSPSELNLGALARSLGSAVALLEGEADRPLEESPVVVAHVRAVLSDLLDAYTRRRGKTVWCEKTPRNAHYRDLLAAVFPDARFICLYRHALDVAISCIDNFRLGFPPVLYDYMVRASGDHVQGAVAYWADVTSGLLEFESRHPDRTFRLRYEDLVGDPEGTLPRLFRYLGLDWDPSLLGSVFTSEHDRGGDGYALYSSHISRSSLGRGRTLPTGKLSADLRARMLGLLQGLGYPELPEPPLEPSTVVPDGPDARWFFETLLPERAGQAAPPAVPLSCDVIVQGSGGGAWLLEWDDGGLRVSPGPGGRPAKIELAAADLLDLVSGKVNPLKLAEEGRIRIEGLETDKALMGLLKLCWMETAPPSTR